MSSTHREMVLVDTKFDYASAERKVLALETDPNLVVDPYYQLAAKYYNKPLAEVTPEERKMVKAFAMYYFYGGYVEMR
jgi:hypothetical protein